MKDIISLLQLRFGECRESNDEFSYHRDIMAISATVNHECALEDEEDNVRIYLEEDNHLISFSHYIDIVPLKVIKNFCTCFFLFLNKNI